MSEVRSESETYKSQKYGHNLCHPYLLSATVLSDKQVYALCLTT